MKEVMLIKGDGEWYRSFIGMDMASKDQVNSVAHKPFLEDRSHTFAFHEVGIIAIVQWSMHDDNQPRSHISVYPLQLSS